MLLPVCVCVRQNRCEEIIGAGEDLGLSFEINLSVFCLYTATQAENFMRLIAIGRRNWVHLGSAQAGPKIGAIFSVIESCRRIDVPIRDYLAKVLPGLANRSIQSIVQLTPAAFAANKLK